MKKITYNNKQYVLNDPQYPVEETVTDTDMNEIKEVVNYNANESENVKNALINIKTEKSSNINVKDSSNLNAKIGVFGISEQETRSGKNKFDVNELVNVTDKKVETGSFIINNSYGTAIMQPDNLVKLLKPNTSYKCVADVTLLEKPDTSSNAYANMLTLYKSVAPQTNTAVLKCNSVEEKNSWQVNTTKRLETDFTTDSDLSQYQLLAYCYSGASGKFKFENIMILESTENDESFEQYGASPSPEFPSEIENVTGDINIKIYNKNLLDLTKCGFSNCVKNEDGSVRSNINNNYYATITTSQLNDFILQSKGKSLTFSFEGIPTKIIGFFIPCKRANSDSDYFETTKTGNSITMQIPENLESLSYIQIRWNRQNTSFTDTTTVINNIQLELNDVKTDFVKHEQQLITFPLSENQKMYEGDYLADDGIHHKKTQVEFDGTEDWEVIYENIFYLELSNTKLFTSAIMTHFKYAKKSLTELLDNEFTTSAGQEHAFWIKKEGMTLEEFKSYLAQQKQAGTPVIVEYELAEEEIEAYTEEQQEAYNQLQNAQSYYNVTNVFTDNALLEFKYIADTQTWVLNKLNNINQELLNIAGGN